MRLGLSIPRTAAGCAARNAWGVAPPGTYPHPFGFTGEVQRAINGTTSLRVMLNDGHDSCRVTAFYSATESCVVQLAEYDSDLADRLSLVRLASGSGVITDSYLVEPLTPKSVRSAA